MTCSTAPTPKILPAGDFFPAWAARTVAIQELRQRLAARSNLLPFITLLHDSYKPGWIHKEVTDLLDAFTEAVERGMQADADPNVQGPRLMVFLPPGHGKSEMVSNKFPAFLLGKHPEWEIVGVTYGQDLANDFGRAVRNSCADPIVQDLFPGLALSKDSNAVDKFSTTLKGAYTAVGVGGPLTGRRAHVLIIDDPVKDREAADSETQRKATWDWYSSVARTRLYPGGGIIVLQTRWHEDDLSGRMLTHAKENPGADQWKVYSFPAIATHDEQHRKKGEALHPERYPLQELQRIRASQQPRDWNALYQQTPVADEGTYYRAETIHTISRDDLPQSLNWYIATDLAIGEKDTNDYTVMTPFAVDHESNLYMDDPIRGRFNGFEIVEQLLDLANERHALLVGIERGHISKSLGPHLSKRMHERDEFVSLYDYVPTKDKQTRGRGAQARMQQKKIFFLRTRWFDETGKPELLAFPAGRHDDYVDTIALAALMLDNVITPAAAPLPKEPEAPKDSWDWMQARKAAPAGHTAHSPRSLFGDRKNKKKHKPLTW